MIFATYSYALFLAVAFFLHWSLPRPMRPWLLILASYFFYATWRWEYLALLVAVTLFNWAYALRVLSRADGAGRLWPGVLANLAVLIYFKYLVFILQSLGVLVGWAGLPWTPPELSIVLPLGVSFFTFQGIAYLVDVASGDKPFVSLRDFMLYKAFWPQLIAGPIVRPEEIREQIETPRTIAYEDISEGVRRIIRGTFKKVVLADSLAEHVDLAFLSQGQPHALDTLAGVVGFGFQVYFDFSAYSDFAIGSARLFGFRFPENFDWPYAARSPQEFWNRWHMTLSRWIRDYVFTPLSFAFRTRPQLRLLWLVLAMGLCGLWHGAHWTFVCWGLWHGIALALQQSALQRLFAEPRGVRLLVAWVCTSLVVFAGWLLFRAPSLASAATHLHALATLAGGTKPALVRENGVLTIGLVAAGSLLTAVIRPLIGKRVEKGGRFDLSASVLRPAVYALLLALVIALDREAKAFVYFQF
jgi:alginate O-acetyltransferase complex protein AlgI